MKGLDVYDKEAEEITLGCVLIDGELFPKLFAMVKGMDFFTDHCRHTFLAMTNLHKRNVPIDQYLVARELTDLGWREDVSSLSRMVYLCPTSYHMEHYAMVVKKFAEKRVKIITAEYKLQEAFKGKNEIKGITL